LLVYLTPLLQDCYIIEKQLHPPSPREGEGGEVFSVGIKVIFSWDKISKYWCTLFNKYCTALPLLPCMWFIAAMVQRTQIFLHTEFRNIPEKYF
jgi:hypothetical protein